MAAIVRRSGASGAVAVTAILFGLAAPVHAQDDKMAAIAIPAQPNAIELGTGALPGAKAKESWHSQYGSVFARNVTIATLTQFLPEPGKATGAAVMTEFRAAQLRNGLLDGRGVVAILGFVGITIGISIGLAFGLRDAGVAYPATWACGFGGLVMGLGGPVLMRMLRRIMLGNRAGSIQ